jgi:hypothetical protein
VSRILVPIIAVVLVMAGCAGNGSKASAPQSTLSLSPSPTPTSSATAATNAPCIADDHYLVAIVNTLFADLGKLKKNTPVSAFEAFVASTRALQSKLRTRSVVPMLRAIKTRLVGDLGQIATGYEEELSAGNNAAYNAGKALLHKGEDDAYDIRYGLVNGLQSLLGGVCH